jgi:hypothetical protein
LVNPLSHVQFAGLCSHSIGDFSHCSLFHCCAKAFCFDVDLPVYFCFWLCFWFHSEKKTKQVYCQEQCHNKFSFSSKNFMIFYTLHVNLWSILRWFLYIVQEMIQLHFIVYGYPFFTKLFKRFSFLYCVFWVLSSKIS